MIKLEQFFKDNEAIANIIFLNKLDTGEKDLEVLEETEMDLLRTAFKEYGKLVIQECASQSYEGILDMKNKLI